MKILKVEDLKNFNENTAITIGFFDGLHLGHQKIINSLLKKSQSSHLKSLIITFLDDVLTLFKMQNCIYDSETKLDIFKQLGVDYVLLLSSKDKFMSLSANEFVKTYLDKLNCKAIICGSDFSFAKNKEGNISFLKENCNYDLVEVDDVYIDGQKISSTYIRKLLLNGEISKANKLLYKPFFVSSFVIDGLKIGRSIGFKTANIKVTSSCYLLKHGVYFGKAMVNDKFYKAMINVGVNPTINDSNILKIEAHILDFNESIYNEKISVIFMYYHRDEKCFSSLDELKNQLSIDAKALNEIIQ
ncbi:MAG: bifunctional riboflavin kinase/FAD synthetase [Erysipelotrichaceae bacterium]|nr:bifunctional riboflavin kinase/FAD synthetase [Erysipelotrichaceae bacterium]